MNFRRSTRSTIYATVLLILAAVSAPLLHAASAVRFRLAKEALIIIPVTADGEGPFYFLLDTGADVTVIDTALANKLALGPLQSAHLDTLNDSVTVSASRLPKLAVGCVHVDHLPVLVQDLSIIRQVDGRIAGILGQDFLSHFNYLLDYHAQSIRFEEADEIRDGIDGDAVPIETTANRMILTAQAQFRGHAQLRLLLDSGSNSLVLIGPVSYPLHCDMQQAQTMSSISSAPTNVGEVDLTVASHKFRDLTVTLATQAPPQPIGDGLLPTSIFDAIYVNNNQSFVVLNPHTKKPPRLPSAGSQKSIHADR